jgi:hypothetical protein
LFQFFLLSILIVASEKVPFRIKPCCGYFMRMGTMDIARERCSACKKRDLFANPKAASEVIDVSTPLISNAFSHSSSSSLAPPSSIIAEVSSFDGLARAGILSDEMGLGKTLEIIGLVVVHPRSSQPFDASGFQTGTYALDKAVRTLSLPLLSAGLTELARLPTTASIAFQVCNSRALRTWNEAMTQTYRSFVRQDMFHLLGSADNSVIDSRATLVIAPASILGQWQSEIARWCPKLAVVVYSSDPNWRFCATSGNWARRAPVAALIRRLMFLQQQKTLLRCSLKKTLPSKMVFIIQKFAHTESNGPVNLENGPVALQLAKRGLACECSYQWHLLI